MWPPPRPSIRGNHLPTQLRRSQVVDFGDRAKFIVGRIDEAAGIHDARVVHQDIDWPSFLLNPVNQIGDLRWVRKVRGVSGTTKRTRQCLNGVFWSVPPAPLWHRLERRY